MVGNAGKSKVGSVIYGRYANPLLKGHEFVQTVEHDIFTKRWLEADDIIYLFSYKAGAGHVIERFRNDRVLKMKLQNFLVETYLTHFVNEAKRICGLQQEVYARERAGSSYIGTRQLSRWRREYANLEASHMLFARLLKVHPTRLTSDIFRQAISEIFKDETGAREGWDYIRKKIGVQYVFRSLKQGDISLLDIAAPGAVGKSFSIVDRDYLKLFFMMDGNFARTCAQNFRVLNHVQQVMAPVWLIKTLPLKDIERKAILEVKKWLPEWRSEFGGIPVEETLRVIDGINGKLKGAAPESIFGAGDFKKFTAWLGEGYDIIREGGITSLIEEERKRRVKKALLESGWIQDDLSLYLSFDQDAADMLKTKDSKEVSGKIIQLMYDIRRLPGYMAPFVKKHLRKLISNPLYPTNRFSSAELARWYLFAHPDAFAEVYVRLRYRNKGTEYPINKAIIDCFGINIDSQYFTDLIDEVQEFENLVDDQKSIHNGRSPILDSPDHKEQYIKFLRLLYGAIEKERTKRPLPNQTNGR